MLAEIFYGNNGKNKLHQLLEKTLKQYNLPTEIYCKENIKAKIQSRIYKTLFLDKKKIGSTPRYITLSKIGFPKI